MWTRIVAGSVAVIGIGMGAVVVSAGGVAQECARDAGAGACGEVAQEPSPRTKTITVTRAPSGKQTASPSGKRTATHTKPPMSEAPRKTVTKTSPPSR